MAKVSVIIPVYNCEDCLRISLDSAVTQTLQDLQIICIDDASTDRSLEILREYAEKDSRVEVIALKNNSGAGAARNAGLKVAVGEYIAFLDSDDFIDFEFYEKLYNAAKAENSDISAGSMRQWGKEQTWLHKEIEQSKYRFTVHFWVGIYKSELIRNNNISFAEDVITGQDVVFLNDVILRANKISVVPGVFYNYVTREGSLYHSLEAIRSPAKIASLILSRNLIIDALNADKEIPGKDYFYRFWHYYKDLFTYAFHTNTSKSVRMTVVQAAIDMYKKCKMKTYLIDAVKKRGKRLADALVSEDAEGIFEFLSRDADWKLELKVLGFIPLLKIKRNDVRTATYVLGIPFLRTKAKNSRLRGKLFFLIPLFDIKFRQTF
jgi:glycosyltransferase involved in cell wall biosynthesis